MHTARSWRPLLGVLVMVVTIHGQDDDAGDFRLALRNTDVHQHASKAEDAERLQHATSSATNFISSLSGSRFQQVPNHKTRLVVPGQIDNGRPNLPTLVRGNAPPWLKLSSGNVAGHDDVGGFTVREKPDSETLLSFHSHRGDKHGASMEKMPKAKRQWNFLTSFHSEGSSPVDRKLELTETVSGPPFRSIVPEVMGFSDLKGDNSAIKQSSYLTLLGEIASHTSNLGKRGLRRGQIEDMAAGTRKITRFTGRHGTAQTKRTKTEAMLHTSNYSVSLSSRGHVRSYKDLKVIEADKPSRRFKHSGERKRREVDPEAEAAQTSPQSSPVNENVTVKEFPSWTSEGDSVNASGVQMVYDEEPAPSEDDYDQNVDEEPAPSEDDYDQNVDKEPAPSEDDYDQNVDWTPETTSPGTTSTSDEAHHSSATMSAIKSTTDTAGYKPTTDTTAYALSTDPSGEPTEAVVGTTESLTQLPETSSTFTEMVDDRREAYTSTNSSAEPAVVTGLTETVETSSSHADPSGDVIDKEKTTTYTESDVVPEFGVTDVVDKSFATVVYESQSTVTQSTAVSEGQTGWVSNDVSVVAELDSKQSTTGSVELGQTSVTGSSSHGPADEVRPINNNGSLVTRESGEKLAFTSSASYLINVTQETPTYPNNTHGTSHSNEVIIATTLPSFRSDQDESKVSTALPSSNTQTTVEDTSQDSLALSPLSTLEVSDPTSTFRSAFILPEGIEVEYSTPEDADFVTGYTSTIGMLSSSHRMETSQDYFPEQTGETKDKPKVPPEPRTSKGGDGVDNGEQTEPASEPDFDWEAAKADWGYFWHLHLYVLGALFGLLGFFALLCIISTWRVRLLLPRPYFVTLNLLVLLLCVSRACYLLVDGYNSQGTLYVALDHFLYLISFPCLTSAFSVQVFALLQATTLQLLPPAIQKMGLLLTIVVLHCGLAISTAVVLSTVPGMAILLLVCQLFFVVWGLFLFFGYIIIFRRLHAQALKRQKNLGKQMPSYHSGTTVTLEVDTRKFMLSGAVKVTLGAAIAGLLVVGLEIYGIVFIYQIFSLTRRQHWPWWIYHTLLRCAEVLMAGLLCYVASHPFRQRREGRCCCPVLCAPCIELCCCCCVGPDASGRHSNNEDVGWPDGDSCLLKISAGQRGDNDYSLVKGRDGRNNGWARETRNWGDTSTIAPKTRICFSDKDHVMPFVTSQHGLGASAGDEELVNYLPVTEREGRYYSGSRLLPYADDYLDEGYNNDSSVFSSTHCQEIGLESFSAHNGVLNTAFHPTAEDGDDDDLVPPSSALLSKSRKSSLASSEFFHPPSSLSIAGSFASELDKAFRSMREESLLADLEPVGDGVGAGVGEGTTTTSLAQFLPDPVDLSRFSRVQPSVVERASSSHPDNTPMERFLLDQQVGECPVGRPMRRSRSAMGRLLEGSSSSVGPSDVEPWDQKLFRSKSDSIGVVCIKQVDGDHYMSMLDVERNQQPVTSRPEDCERWLKRDADEVRQNPSVGGVAMDRALAGRREVEDYGANGSTEQELFDPTSHFNNQEMGRSLLTPIDYHSDDIEV